MHKKGFTNTNSYNELVKELVLLAEMEGAQSTCLNIIENLPSESQLKILQGLAKTNNPRLISFFQLIAQEMSGEIQKIACKTLRKYEYLGYQVSAILTPKKIQVQDVQAFVSSSRLEGVCILVFVVGREKEYHAHYFSLAFNHVGIKEYFQHTSTSKEDLLAIINKQKLTGISFYQGQQLLRDAYSQNKRYGTKPASGLSQYEHLLTTDENTKDKEAQLTPPQLIEKEANPERIVNAYFLALKNMDGALVYDLAAPALQQKLGGNREEFSANWVHPFEKFVFIKSLPLSRKEDENSLRACYQLIASNENDELKKIDFDFQLEKINEGWYISEIRIESFSAITDSDPLNPLNYQVYAGVYHIACYSTLENFFKSWDQVHLTGEFEGGTCYKWFKAGEPLDLGLDISRDIYGEFILSNEELIIFSKSPKNVTEIEYYFQELIKDKTGFDFHLKAKGSCLVREVYQVITDKEFCLGEELLKKNGVYHLDLISYQYWYNLFKDKAQDRFMLGTSIQVFQISQEQNLLEVLFYKNHAFIFSYNAAIEQWQRNLPHLKDSLSQITGELESKSEIEKWQYYKLLSKLKKDAYTKIFVPQDSQRGISKRLRSVN